MTAGFSAVLVKLGDESLAGLKSLEKLMSNDLKEYTIPLLLFVVAKTASGSFDLGSSLLVYAKQLVSNAYFRQNRSSNSAKVLSLLKNI